MSMVVCKLRNSNLLSANKFLLVTFRKIREKVLCPYSKKLSLKTGTLLGVRTLDVPNRLFSLSAYVIQVCVRMMRRLER